MKREDLGTDIPRNRPKRDGEGECEDVDHQHGCYAAESEVRFVELVRWRKDADEIG